MIKKIFYLLLNKLCYFEKFLRDVKHLILIVVTLLILFARGLSILRRSGVHRGLNYFRFLVSLGHKALREVDVLPRANIRPAGINSAQLASGNSR